MSLPNYNFESCSANCVYLEEQSNEKSCFHHMLRSSCPSNWRFVKHSQKTMFTGCYTLSLIKLRNVLEVNTKTLYSKAYKYIWSGWLQPLPLPWWVWLFGMRSGQRLTWSVIQTIKNPCLGLPMLVALNHRQSWNRNDLNMIIAKNKEGCFVSARAFGGKRTMSTTCWRLPKRLFSNNNSENCSKICSYMDQAKSTRLNYHLLCNIK